MMPYSIVPSSKCVDSKPAQSSVHRRHSEGNRERAGRSSNQGLALGRDRWRRTSGASLLSCICSIEQYFVASSSHPNTPKRGSYQQSIWPVDKYMGNRGKAKQPQVSSDGTAAIPIVVCASYSGAQDTRMLHPLLSLTVGPYHPHPHHANSRSTTSC